MRAMRVTRVDDEFYKLELVDLKSDYGARVGRAMNRAVAISGLPILDFFRAMLNELGIPLEQAIALFAHSGLTLETAAHACIRGEVVVCSDVLLASATVAGTPVGVLLEESSMADQVRVLIAEVRELRREPRLISGGATSA